jgi:hypothetical protein
MNSFYQRHPKLWDIVFTSLIIILLLYLFEVEFAMSSPLITFGGVTAGCWFGYSFAQELHSAVKKKRY